MIRVLKVLACVALVAVLLAFPTQSQACHHGCGYGCCDSWGLCGYGGWGTGYAYGWGCGCGGWGGYGGCGWGGCGWHHGCGGCGFGCGGCGFGCPVVVASVPCCDTCGWGCGCGSVGVGVVSGGCGCGGGGVIEGAPMSAPMAAPSMPTPATPPATVPVQPHTLNGHNDSGTITIWVPEDAKVYVNGYLTKSTGNRRQFVSYGLKDGMNYKYDVRAVVSREGKDLEETHSVALTAGSKSTVAFKFDSKANNVASIW